MTRALAVNVALVLMASIGCTPGVKRRLENKWRGRVAPDFELAALDGGSVRLSDLRGKPVMLVFWVYGCGSCRGRAEWNTESYVPELNTASTVGTARSVYASLRKHEAFHRSTADKVRLNDFFNIFSLDEAVPDRLGIDDDCRPMLALI